jgi:hypothetical protein
MRNLIGFRCFSQTGEKIPNSTKMPFAYFFDLLAAVQVFSFWLPVPDVSFLVFSLPSTFGNELVRAKSTRSYRPVQN